MGERHLDDVLAIERASFASPWSREHFLAELSGSPWSRSVVVTLGDRVIGYACVREIQGELRIHNLALEPGQRRRGLGAWLLRHVLCDGRRRGCGTATLEVRVSNRAAIELYRRHGFVEVGRRKAYYQPEAEDAILMTARLDPGAEPAPEGEEAR